VEGRSLWSGPNYVAACYLIGDVNFISLWIEQIKKITTIKNRLKFYLFIIR